MKAFYSMMVLVFLLGCDVFKSPERIAKEKELDELLEQIDSINVAHDSLWIVYNKSTGIKKIDTYLLIGHNISTHGKKLIEAYDAKIEIDNTK